MALSKDAIDGVSIVLDVDGQPTFMLMLTRGGLTKRRGSSAAVKQSPITVTGATDGVFDAFMDAVPLDLLGQGAVLEDPGTDGPRHEWRIEFAGGPHIVTYELSYHWGSAALPDVFEDLVGLGERLTEEWYARGVAEETGGAAASVPVSAPPRESKAASPAAAPETGRSAARKTGSERPAPRPRAQPLPASRERIALAVLLDLFTLKIPYAMLHRLFIGTGPRVGPPGGALILFAAVEFALLQFARTSPGYWLLGISAPLGAKPRVDPAWSPRESPATLAAGTALYGVGAIGISAWTTYHMSIPYFGLGFPIWLSIPLTLLGCVGLLVAGVLVLRTDIRGVWLGGGLVALMLLAALVGWSGWSGFVEASLSARAAQRGTDVGGGVLDVARAVVPPLVLVGPVALLAGLALGFRRLWRRAGSIPWTAPARG